MERDAKNHIDLIRAGGQNSEGLHRNVQKQLAGSKPGGPRGLSRVLRETQCEDRGVNKQRTEDLNKIRLYLFRMIYDC